MKVRDSQDALSHPRVYKAVDLLGLLEVKKEKVIGIHDQRLRCADYESLGGGIQKKQRASKIGSRSGSSPCRSLYATK